MQENEDRNEIISDPEEVEETNLTEVSEEVKTENEEEKELTEEEKHDLFIKALKESKIRFKNTISKGNVTVTKFGPEYRKKRQSRNKMARASRKLARKK
jgi:hypothetical protein